MSWCTKLATLRSAVRNLIKLSDIVSLGPILASFGPRARCRPVRQRAGGIDANVRIVSFRGLRINQKTDDSMESIIIGIEDDWTNTNQRSSGFTIPKLIKINIVDDDSAFVL